jgi:hypothetical protein
VFEIFSVDVQILLKNDSYCIIVIIVINTILNFSLRLHMKNFVLTKLKHHSIFIYILKKAIGFGYLLYATHAYKVCSEKRIKHISSFFFFLTTSMLLLRALRVAAKSF